MDQLAVDVELLHQLLCFSVVDFHRPLNFRCGKIPTRSNCQHTGQFAKYRAADPVRHYHGVGFVTALGKESIGQIAEQHLAETLAAYDHIMVFVVRPHLSGMRQATELNINWWSAGSKEL